jgi:glycosyltransferase involved in cell wall biosynthesis
MSPPTVRRRIACVHLYDDFSGSAKVFAHALGELAAAGAELRVVVGSAGERGFIRAAHATETVFYRFTENRLLLLAHFALAQIWIFLKVLRLCLFWRADVVYANTVLNPGAVLAGRLCGRRVVVHVHEVGLGSRLLFRVLLGVARRGAHRIVCVSNYVRTALRLQEGRAVIVYNSLPPAEWDKALTIAATRATTAGSPFLVFMASSLKWYKGVDSFLELARRAQANGTAPGATYRLAINCTVGEWREFARTASLPANLDVVLRPPDIYSHYAAAGLVLNLSHPEGWVETFGMTLLEAMVCGVPVICPTVGGCTELFDDGVGGWRKSSRDLDSIDAIVQRLAHEPELLGECRRAASDNSRRFEPANFAAGLRAAVLDV